MPLHVTNCRLRGSFLTRRSARAHTELKINAFTLITCETYGNKKKRKTCEIYRRGLYGLNKRVNDYTVKPQSERKLAGLFYE